jgi:2-polyprenyl-3-methyl-5-hydroxy-6-metoxy-1,4-benzoquinol methylase
MYGKDVKETPELKISKYENGSELNSFKTILDSLDEMIESRHIIYLIKDGIFNNNWRNSRVMEILNNCLNKECCKFTDTCWNEAKNIILGYQEKDLDWAFRLNICDNNYQPGTFTIDQIRKDSQFLNDSQDFEVWIKSAIDDELCLIKKYYSKFFIDVDLTTISDKVKSSLEKNPGGCDPLKNEIWFQEYSDIIRRIIISMIVGNPDYYLDIYPELTYLRKDFMFNILDYLEKKDLQLNDWLHISIAAGLLGINEKPVHAATSNIDATMAIKFPTINEHGQSVIESVSENLIKTSQTKCRIDATNRFMQTLRMNESYDFTIVSFPDDYFETIILLKYYEKLLIKFPKLKIYCIPRSIRCGNDATYEDVVGFLENMPALNNQDRFILRSDGPKIGGVNLKKLSREVLEIINKCDLIDVRGARNYEMMQGINKETYFGFMVCREISEYVTGLSANDLPLIYIRQPPMSRSFEGFNSGNKLTENKKKIALKCVNDNPAKWAGGYISEFDSWDNRRKIAFETNMNFYSSKAKDFHKKYGDVLEDSVKKMLIKFSGRKVLVLGCGSGKEVEFLSNMSCDVTGIDFSYQAINIAKKDHPNIMAKFVVEDYYNLGIIIGEIFDGIVANASLVHLLEKQDMIIILKKIWDRLIPDGLCFIRIIEKGNLDDEIDNYQLKEWRWFVYYRESEITCMASQVGFKVIETIRDQHDKGYKNVYWISILLKKPAMI